MALDASIIIRAIDRATAPMRRVTKNFKAMKDAAKVADKQFKRAADMRQAAEGVSRFASAARGAIGGPIEAAQNFNYEMSRVRALSKANAKDFTILRDKALELGASIGEFSALDAAKGMSEFATAGYGTEQILKALPTTLDLATAAQTSLAETIKITTGVMGGFNLGAGEAVDVGNVLAATMTGSKTTLQTLGETFSYVGPAAAAAGVSLRDAAVIAGMLGEASIDSSRAGTALNAMLLRLAAPRKLGLKAMRALGLQVEETVNGVKKMRGPVDILADMADKMKDMGNVKQIAFMKAIFGQEAVPAAIKLMNTIGGDRMRKLDQDVRNASGSLDQMAKTMRDNSKTAAMELSSSVQTLAINTGDALDPAMTSLNRSLSGVVLSLNNAAKRHPTLTKLTMGTIGVTAILASGLAALMFATVAASTTLGVLAVAMGSSKTGTQLLGAALRATVLRIKAFAVAVWTRALPAVGRWALAMAMQLAPNLTIMAAGIWATVVPAIQGFALTVWTRAIPAMIAWIAKMWAAAPAALASVAPFLAIAAAIGAITLAVVQLVKHWGELDFMEGVQGIIETAGESGILSTIGELFDPRTLLKDMGVIGGAGAASAAIMAPTVTAPDVGRGMQQQMAGKLAISIDAEGRPNVRQAESTGLQMDVDTGYAMVTP